MSLIASDGFKDLCAEVDNDHEDDSGDREESVFNSLDSTNLNENNQIGENSVEDVSVDKLSTDCEIPASEKSIEHFSLNLNLGQKGQIQPENVSNG